MKDTLQLHELAGYLPYGLKWDLQGLKQFTMTGITPETLFTEEGTVLTWPKHPDLPQGLFPILYPYSELLRSKENSNYYSSIEIIVMHTDQHCDCYDEWAQSYLDNPEPSRLLQAPYEVIQ